MFVSSEHLILLSDLFLYVSQFGLHVSKLGQNQLKFGIFLRVFFSHTTDQPSHSNDIVYYTKLISHYMPFNVVVSFKNFEHTVWFLIIFFLLTEAVVKLSLSKIYLWFLQLDKNPILVS